MSELTCNCPHCGQELNVSSEFSGQVVACPQCSGEFEVPTAPAAPTLNAPALNVPPAGPRLNAPAIQNTPPGQPPAFNQGPPQQPQMQPGPYQQPPMPGSYPPGGMHPSYAAPGGIGSAFGNPVEGQPIAIQGLGSGGTIGWAIGLCLSWVIVAWLFAWRTGSAFNSALGGSSSSQFGLEKLDAAHGKWIVSAFIPVIILILVLFAIRAIARKSTSFGAVAFTAGMATLPISGLLLVLLMFSYLKPESISEFTMIGHLTMLAIVSGLCTFTQLLVASLVNVIGISQKAAFWLTPYVLVGVIYLSNWIGNLVN